MTTQEFVKKHVDEMFLNIYPVAPESNAELRIQDEYSYGLKMGLSVGLDIAESIVWDILSQFGDPSDPKIVIEHYLTEKYGK